MKRTTNHLRRAAAALLLMSLTWALAQVDTYRNDAFGFSMVAPSAWTAAEEAFGAQSLSLEFSTSDGAGAVLVLVEALGPEDLAYFQQSSAEELNAEIWGGFVDMLPGAQMTGSYPLTVGGAAATAIDYVGPGISGSIVYFGQGDRVYIMAAAGSEANAQEVSVAFGTMLTSFAFTSGGAPTTPAGGGGSPFDPPAQGGQNPLAPPADPFAGGGDGTDHFTGTFVGDQMSLTLQGGQGQYSGQIVFNGQVFPLTAQAQGSEMRGVFESAGAQFPFTAWLDGGGTMLTFETAGNSYLLSR